MAKLWEVEAAARAQSPDGRVAARQATSAAVVNELFALWQKTLPRISGKSKLAETIRYATSRRSIFERFLTDGRIELDSNIVERATRPQTTTRKNSLFVGSDGGGRTWAAIATLLQTAKMNTSIRRHVSSDARAHRQRLAQQQSQCAHAVELRSLNGLSLPLTGKPQRAALCTRETSADGARQT